MYKAFCTCLKIVQAKDGGRFIRNYQNKIIMYGEKSYFNKGSKAGISCFA